MDALYYKLRSIENDLRYIETEVKRQGFSTVFSSVERRKSVREMLANSARYVESIQKEIPSEFHPEF